MDLRMPQMDGIEATRAIRALGGAWSEIPIVALTANAFPEDVKECRSAGMNDFIAKPIRKKVLLERTAAALADHPLLRAVTSVSTPPAHETVAPAAEILDRSMIDELIEALGHAGVRAMLDVFVAETTARLGVLGALSCANDRARIRDEAHTLKGAAATAGLSELSRQAAALEQAAATNAPADYTGALQRLEKSFAAARGELDRMLAGTPVAA
jgi:CheY-like chemotaxis protein